MMHIDIAWKSFNKFGEELCGDKVEIFHAPDSDMIVLSDGLGSGVKANIQATLTSKIIVTMLKEGLNVDEAVDTLAHTLPVCKVRQVAYSTFSILQLFHDGKAYLVEFDGPACVFIRDGRIVDLPYEMREIAGKHVRECRFDVNLGDTFCLVSDGVVFAGVGTFINLGWEWDNLAAYVQECVQKKMGAHRAVAAIGQVVDSLYMSKPGDDCTILVAQAVSRKNVHLFSGPPADPAQDEKLVHDFMRGACKKVVAGGTAANIISRVLNRQIVTSLNFTDPSLPPTAAIKGMDLVTDGVLTINRALEVLRTCNAQDGSIDPRILDADNGAAKLARLLIEECTDLTMYVGSAVNPAHQNPNLPMNLSIRLRLLSELAEEMRAMGRRVEVRYY